MINELCGLLMASTRPELLPELRAALEFSISPSSHARLQTALDASPPHHLLARQPILVALARTFIDDGKFAWVPAYRQVCLPRPRP